MRSITLGNEDNNQAIQAGRSLKENGASTLVNVNLQQVIPPDSTPSIGPLQQISLNK